MDIREVRRERLKAAISEFKSTAEFAREHGLDPSFISQILTGHRNLGEKGARKLEQAIDKPDRWLDEPSGSTAAATIEPVEPALSREAAAIVRRVRQLDGQGRLPSALAHWVLDVLKTAPESANAARAGGVMQKHTTQGAMANLDMHANADKFAGQTTETIKKMRKPRGKAETEDLSDGKSSLG